MIVILSNNLWLGREDAKITLDLDGADCDVQEIREWLDDDNKVSTVRAMSSADNSTVNIMKLLSK